VGGVVPWVAGGGGGVAPPPPATGPTDIEELARRPAATPVA